MSHQTYVAEKQAGHGQELRNALKCNDANKWLRICSDAADTFYETWEMPKDTRQVLKTPATNSTATAANNKPAAEKRAEEDKEGAEKEAQEESWQSSKKCIRIAVDNIALAEILNGHDLLTSDGLWRVFMRFLVRAQ